MDAIEFIIYTLLTLVLIAFIGYIIYYNYTYKNTNKNINYTGVFNFSSYNFICYFFNKQTIILKKYIF